MQASRETVLSEGEVSGVGCGNDDAVEGFLVEHGARAGVNILDSVGSGGRLQFVWIGIAQGNQFGVRVG